MDIFKNKRILVSVAVAACCIFSMGSCSSKYGIYTIQNGGVSAGVCPFGARLTSLKVPASEGRTVDIVWGYETLEEYRNSVDRYCGPVVGRYANRIGKGRFTLDGKEYQLETNEGENICHGGVRGFSERDWTVELVTDTLVRLSYLSPDGEAGFPGNVKVYVTYALTSAGELKVDYSAETDAPTIVNVTMHPYFNLHGTSRYPITTHILTINADGFTPTDSGLIPTGEIMPVEGTPMDFRTPMPVGARVDRKDFAPIEAGGGYDHNWVLNRDVPEVMYGNTYFFAAEVFEPATGVDMKIYTDQPGIQFYSGNYQRGADIGRDGCRNTLHSGMALETQNFPDAPNHDNFPSAVLRPGETYEHHSLYRFEARPVIPDSITVGGEPMHVQGIAVDRQKQCCYFSFTSRFIKTDLEGNILGSIDRIPGHLGDMEINPEDGKVYASLECKDDEIGRGVAAKLGIENVAEGASSFYVAVIDPDKLEIEKTVLIEDACRDYAEDDHRFGCSGIDGLTFAPAPGEPSGRQYLYVAYGIYGDTTRTDNDCQVILRYDPYDFDDVAKAPLDKYFVFTGNTTYGVQNMAYDPYKDVIFLAVYKGRKSGFPNYRLFAIDLMQKPDSENRLSLWDKGLYDTSTGLTGWNFQWGSTGFCPLGCGYYLISEDFRDEEGLNGCKAVLYRWNEDSGEPFVRN
jgi:Galactose mutarotase and related enzymes